MNIYESLKQIECSNNEKILRDFILEDPNRFLDMKTDEVAKQLHISRSTIYRLCEKLNVDGISNLKIRLFSDIDSWKESQSDFNFDFPVKDGVSVQKIATQLQEDYAKTILLTQNLFDPASFRTAANLMNQANAIDIYTSAGNIYFAQNFAFQMKEIGKDVNVPQELYLQLLTAASSDSSHFAIVISFHGRNLQIEPVLKKLKQNGTKILLICSPEAKEIMSYADSVLYFSNYENHYKKISSFSTRLSLLYILDTLYTCYFELDYHNNVEKKENFYHKLVL